MNIFDFFTDAVLRGPTLGSMALAGVAALMGVIVFVRKHSLLGEALSHATYPGIALAALGAGIYVCEEFLPFLILVGASFTTLLGLGCIHFLQRKKGISPDAALSVVLSLFFGVGILATSYCQAFYPHLFREVQICLYGQAATLTDQHIFTYCALLIGVTLFITLFYRSIHSLLFDRAFARSLGIFCSLLDGILFVMTVLVVVTAIRTVGVVLLSALLIAPAVAARYHTHKLSSMFFLAAFFGILGAFLGNYFSFIFARDSSLEHPLPTGPLIVLMCAALALYSLLFAPQKGIMIRYWRIVRFQRLKIEENMLKSLWKKSLGGEKSVEFSSIQKGHAGSAFYLKRLLFRLSLKGWLKKKKNQFYLTEKGIGRGREIVRLHRLWEVYLAHSLGMHIEKVHINAEEMEHVLTPELEKKLTALLNDPKQDPHDQPIPSYIPSTSRIRGPT